MRAIGAAALLVAAATVLTTNPANARRTDQAVSMSVVSITPSAPTASSKLRPLTIRLSLTNMTDEPLKKITISGLRGGPITTVRDLDAAIAKPREPASDNPITTKKPVTTDLAAGATVTVDYRTTTSVTDQLDPGICVCTKGGVYPLNFTASNSDAVLGTTQTYLPAFYDRPPTAQISWVWPLLDRPHRLQSEDVFLDDDLAASVDGGRLDHALQALENAASAAPGVAVTIVADPELLSELQVMASGHYRVQPPGKTAVAGTGGTAAAAWLTRLRNLLAADASMQVVLTPFADPDYDTVTRAQLPWTAALPDTMRTQVATALGTDVPTTTMAWPIAGAIRPATATALADAGVSTVLLGSNALPAADLPDDGATVTVTTKQGSFAVAHTDRDVEKVVTQAVSVGGSGDAALPVLLAHIGVRVAADVEAGRTTPHQLVLAPPRAADIAPDAAAHAIVATTSAVPWTQSVQLGAFAPEGRAVAARALVAPRASAPSLSAGIVSGAQEVDDALPALTSLLRDPSGPAPANAFLDSLSVALQRLESAGWTDDAAAGEAGSRTLTGLVAGVQKGVFIVKPSSGYTLASNSSPLPLTLENDLDYRVRVVIHMETMNSLPGFHAKDRTTALEPHSKTPVKVDATLDRSGRIEVQAVLRTVSGAPLGEPVRLSVRTTALGFIGVIIMIVSGAVLVLALIRRLWQRYRHRGAPPPEPAADLAPIPQSPAEPAR